MKKPFYEPLELLCGECKSPMVRSRREDGMFYRCTQRQCGQKGVQFHLPWKTMDQAEPIESTERDII